MRLRYFKSRSCCLFLVLLILFQSCVAYQSKPATLQQAAEAKTRVLLTRTNNKKLRFNRIEQIEGQYYGKQNVKGQKANVPLAENDIKSIRIMDKSKTVWANIGFALISIVVIIVVVVALSGSVVPEGNFEGSG